MSLSKLMMALLFGLALVGLVVIGLSFFRQLGCEGQMVNINFEPAAHQEIWGDRFIGQTFIAPRDGLNRVELMLHTYRRQNTGDVTFRLLEIPPGAFDPLQALERFRTTFNAKTVHDQTWYTFRFPAITNSAGKTYLVILQSPTSESGNAITTGGIDRNIYPSGSAFFGPVQVDGDLTFRACFELSVAEKLQFLADKLTRNRPGVWGNFAFYLTGLVVYWVVLLGYFWGLIRWG